MAGSASKRCVSALARGLLVLSTMASASCLVTTDPDFRGQEDCIPFFVTQEADPPLTDRTIIDLAGGASAEFRASIPLRSCALTKNYELHIFLDDDLRSVLQVPPTGDEERPVNVLVNLDFPTTKPGCHQVEARVSSRFSLDFRTPERAGDLAYAVWWISSSPETPFGQCGAR